VGQSDAFLIFIVSKGPCLCWSKCFLYITEMLCFISSNKGNSKQWSRLCLFF